MKIIRFREEEVEYDEGGIHYICFLPGEIGLFDEYELPSELVNLIDAICGSHAEFKHFRAWNITKCYNEVIKILRNYGIKV